MDISEEAPVEVDPAHLISNWDNLQFFLKRHITGDDRGMGLKTFTDVQVKAIPPIIAGKNCLIRAETGSGKTMTYLIPIVNWMAHQEDLSREMGTLAIVIAPTQELVTQIADVASLLSKPFPQVVVSTLVGGASRKSEKARLRKGVGIVVATPGRLLDHLRQTTAFVDNVKGLRYLVFDESDRLLDMGFQKDMVNILATLDQAAVHTPGAPTRQNLLLSATVGPELKAFSDPLMKGGERVFMDDCGDEEAFKLPPTLSQEYVYVPPRKKISTLLALLAPRETKKTLVFVATIDTVRLLEALLAELTSNKTFMSDPAAIFTLHGNMDSAERADTIRRFRDAKKGVLVATDVAARGIDIPVLDLVVQVDPPADVRSYVHRVGRTARIGNDGRAVLFVLPNIEDGFVRFLEESNINITKRSLEKFLIEAFGRKASRDGWIAVQDGIERTVRESEPLSSMARNAYLSWTRAYVVRAGKMREIFNLGKLDKEKKAELLGQACHSFGLSETPKAIAARMRDEHMAAVRAKRREQDAEELQRKRKNKLGTRVDRVHNRDNRSVGNGGERRNVFGKVKVKRGGRGGRGGRGPKRL